MKRVLPIIVFAQFFCTSLWFAGNAILPDIIKTFHLEAGFLAHLTSAVQFGFITGTLVFAVFTIADRFSPSMVFFCCAVLAGLCNLGIILENTNAGALLLFRYFTGFFLAGIYPVGMKIASDHFEKGLGKSLGFLVGALVVGTAFPHLLKSMATGFPWKYIVWATTLLSVLGGLIMVLFVSNGPYRKPAQQLHFTAFLLGFRQSKFRSVAFGYFGHMWELYTFWAFVPVMLATYNSHFPTAHLPVPLLSFLIIALGGLACVSGGILSQYFSTKRLATIALFLSCMCCLLSPLFLHSSAIPVLLAFLFFWGLVVIADSPLFSTLVAQNAPEDSRGAALTIVNCIGFSITIVSIQLLQLLSQKIDPQYVYVFLAIGPVLGLIALMREKQNPTS